MFAACPMPPESRPPKPPDDGGPKRPAPRFPWLVLLLAVLLVEFFLPPLRAPRRQALPEVDGAVLVTQDHGWTMGEKPPRRLVPPTPLPEWEKVPCREPWMVPLNGACWAKVEKARPPCTVGLYEHGGGCYAPITKGNRPPSSLRR